MNETAVSIRDIQDLTLLASTIVPADNRDSGAAGVHAGPIIADKMRRGPFGELYCNGLAHVRSLASKLYNRQLRELDSLQLQSLVE